VKEGQEPFILWTEAEFDALADKAKSLVRSSEQLQEYTADELMEHALKMGEAAKRIFKQAGLIGDPELAVKLFGVGAKLHAEWRETLLPFTKRVWTTEEKNASKQVSGPRRLRIAEGSGQRRGKGEPRTETDAGTPRCDGEVEAQPLGLPDGDRSGDGDAPHLDDRPETEERPA
jgi:hypothetical protein